MEKTRLSRLVQMTAITAAISICAVMIAAALVAPSIRHSGSPGNVETISLKPTADFLTVPLSDYSEAGDYLRSGVLALANPQSLAGTTTNSGTAGSAGTSTDKGVQMLHNAKLWSQMKRLYIFSGGDDTMGIVAPGDSGTYPFDMVNSSNFPAVFTMNVSETNEMDISLEYRLRKNGNYILGNEQEWVTLSEPLKLDGEIGNNEEHQYELDWRWEFYVDDSSDTKDTNLGVLSVEKLVDYHLNFKVDIMQSGGASDTPETGDSFPLWTIGIIAGLSAAAVLLLFILLLLGKRRKQEEDA